MVYGRGKAPVGCYLYYGRPGGIAWVLQILALPEATDAVVANLLNHAEAHGSVAVHGRTQPHLLDTLLAQPLCVLPALVDHGLFEQCRPAGRDPRR